jgi:hypothetical protein
VVVAAAPDHDLGERAEGLLDVPPASAVAAASWPAAIAAASTIRGFFRNRSLRLAITHIFDQPQGRL